MTQWTITIDHNPDPRAKPGTNCNAAGIVGPRGAKLTAQQICEHPDRQEFRMYDDDNELYYTGFLVGPDLFAPLDDFGTPNAGATRIDVKNAQGIWETV